MISPEKLGVLESVLRPFPKPQRKTVALAVQAMVWLSQAASIAIAAFFAQVTGSQVDSALTRFYRLLHNPRFDDLQMTKQVLSLLAKRPVPFLVALDWTEWHPPLRMLLASVVVGSRALPVQAAVFRKPRSFGLRIPGRTTFYVFFVFF
jgi:hypothetical protein